MIRYLYTFAYRSGINTRTQYVYVVATTIRQAQHFWFKYIKPFGKMYYISYVPEGVSQYTGTRYHIGSVLGEEADVYA